MNLMKKLLSIFLFLIPMVCISQVNDLCTGSITISDFGCWDGDNTGASDDVPSCSGCQSPNCGRWDEVWFDITPTTSSLTYTLTGSGSFSDMSIVLYSVPSSGCPGNGDDLQSDCGAPPIDGTFTGLTPGTTYYLAISGVDNEEGEFNICFGTSLPIELTSFNGTNEEVFNRIQWVTASETNNDSFFLERSENGEDWEIISEQAGAGNSTSELKYEYIDRDYKKVINYYRLTQLDYNGEYDRSEIFSIDNRKKEPPTIIKVINLMNQEVDDTYEGIRVIIYSDGSQIKKIGK
ncbi:MAG: putative Fn3-like protein [uncultured marine phage]|uniref:Putative Fn3-like protein n=1 Tax=uncultured marine phage TaxID=707152 RepID=A0A8D9C9S7_9VIRU|nr:MAG: putative Fn3-like protein [uncultured marine phage]